MLDALISMLNVLPAGQFFNNISKQTYVGYRNVALPKPGSLTLSILLSISPLVLSPFLVSCLYGSWQVFELW
jgi:hypothetical protein